MKNKTIWRTAFCTVFCLLVCVILCAASELDNIKADFLNEDYKSAITAGEKLLAVRSEDDPRLDELYYLLGLAYYKDGNYLRASDIFEIIIDEFPGSRLRREAQVGLGDSYFALGNYPLAKKTYSKLLAAGKNDKFLPVAYYRLSRTALKMGDTREAQGYLKKLKKDFPDSGEDTNEGFLLEPEIYYTVQVGAFSSKKNAQGLQKKLTEKGYPVYLEEFMAKDRLNYRVRVGKLSTRKEAQELENNLAQEGYPTKIFP